MSNLVEFAAKRYVPGKGSITPAYACTSFAVYAEQPLYAMNFDYYNTKIRFCILEDRERDLSVFVLIFNYNGYDASTVMMNNKGQFGCSQQQYPAEAGKSVRSEGEIFCHQLLAMHMAESGLEEVLLQLNNKRIVHWENITTHVLLADISGNAAIIEAGADGNEIFPIADGFIAMTNFKHSDFRDMPLGQISGTGADRYRAACKFLAQSRENFSIDDAFACLQKTAQGITLCSMVFEPRENCIYLALDKKFDKLWKISIEDRTIETYRGFQENLKFQIPEGMKGITTSDLVQDNFSNDLPNNLESSLEMGIWVYLLFSAFGAALLAGLIFLLRHIKKNHGYKHV